MAANSDAVQLALNQASLAERMRLSERRNVQAASTAGLVLPRVLHACCSCNEACRHTNSCTWCVLSCNASAEPQDLVTAKVQLDGMGRRLELAERERERAAATLRDTQAGLGTSRDQHRNCGPHLDTFVGLAVAP